jgi:KUP system potassium uptake protein
MSNAHPSATIAPSSGFRRAHAARGDGSSRRSRGKQAGQLGLALGALGVVFGDIGTSPLYALQTVFSIGHDAVHTTSANILGIVSLVFWSITVVVSVKYLLFILYADNEGEGGIMALTALLKRTLAGDRRRMAVVLGLGILGASLFYGDSVITPAISVLSAVEGLQVAAPSVAHLVLPISIGLLAALFLLQRFGTHRVGGLFGPVMVVWFIVIGLAGLARVAHDPSILRGLSPSYAASFIFDRPYVAFIAMGAVVLAITGAEALYADMGHFGRPPIQRAWFALVFPSLTLNYLGQSSLILHAPRTISDPFFLLMPAWSRIPMVVLASVATVIASQAVISGAFSVSRQAMQLGFLPRLIVRHTGKHDEGQIYVPVVNWLLFAAVVVVCVLFRTSARLATAYGVAVTGTFIINTLLFLAVARSLWRWSTPRLIAAGCAFLIVEVTFFAANILKIVSGGWLPLLIAGCVCGVMLTWQRGREIVTEHRTTQEGDLRAFIAHVQTAHVPRVRGTAVFPHPNTTTTPFALRANVEHNTVLHERVVIFSARSETVPHVLPAKRVSVDDLGDADDGIFAITARFGFQDVPDIPAALRLAAAKYPRLGLDPERASYFLSRATLVLTDEKGLARWRKKLFLLLARNAANPAEVFCLPENRTVVMGVQVHV